MCDPTVASFASGAIGAIGSANEAANQNAAAQRQYNHKLKMRERKWMADTTTFKTKVVQYEKNVSEANLAAQKAYLDSQISFNNVRVQAMLDHQDDFINMLKAEGDLISSAAERGIRGGSVTRGLVNNLGKMGVANRARSRALTQTQYAFKQGNENIRRQLISDKNKEWSGVSMQLFPDLAPPEPVKRSVGGALFLGLASAGLDAAGTYMENKPKTFDFSKDNTMTNYWS